MESQTSPMVDMIKEQFDKYLGEQDMFTLDKLDSILNVDGP